MSSTTKLHSDRGNFQALKIQIAADLTNSNLQVLEVKHNDCVAPFLVKPSLPLLEVTDGEFLFSVNSAAKYLFLKAGMVKDESKEDAILDWEHSELFPLTASYLLSSVGSTKKDAEIENRLIKAIKYLDSCLVSTTFLSGEEPGVSDVCVFSTVAPLLNLKNCDILSQQSKVNQWCSQMKAIPPVQAAFSAFSAVQLQEDFKASLTSQNFPSPTIDSPKTAQQKSGVARNVSTASSTQASVASEDQLPAEKVSQEEMDSALKAWKKDVESHPKPRLRQYPVLPEAGSRNVLITSALPYVNNVPHLGNIIGCVLSADVFSRFSRLRNYNVLYICGTDEYGTATETKAMEEGVTPQQICDKYSKLHAEIYKWFNIDFDYFGRTSTKQQTEIAQDIFWKLYEAGYVLKDSVEQLLCTKCNKFLADRFVEGKCPLCGFDDARGDQCDACGKLINAVELIDPKCKMCKSSPIVKSSNHLFVDLPKLEPLLQKHLDEQFSSGTWTNNAKVITNSWIRDGLKPRCISRDLKWGTPVPLEGYTDKVFYVWFDAPIGYLSITANYTDKWQQWWKNPDQVEMYNFLGKDNVPFHSVIFPSCLLGANDGYTVVNHMSATEYLNYEDTKFSKSRNSGVFGDQAETTGIPADIYRFYLLFLRPESQDTAFSWDDFILKNNSELLNNLGNFINRALTFLYNNFEGVIQEMKETEDDLQLLAQITRELSKFISNLEACKIKDGIRNILMISKLGNQYMQANKPWVLAKGSTDEKRRAGSVVSLCANVACLLSVLLQPYMPSTSATIQSQLQAPNTVNVITEDFHAALPTGHKIGKPSPLFQKIEPATIEELKSRFAGKPEQKESKKAPKKNPKAGGDNNTVKVVSAEEIQKLTQQVAEQGIKVRELKAAKGDASAISAEVTVLLNLKKQLAEAQGGEPETQSKKGKKGKDGNKGHNKDKQPKKEPTPHKEGAVANGTAADSVAVERLTQSVADQGNKVRELKTAKADKASIGAEVEKLLQLKKELAIAQGLDPDVAVGGGKKGKKK